jgi:hypothetical protein
MMARSARGLATPGIHMTGPYRPPPGLTNYQSKSGAF